MQNIELITQNTPSCIYCNTSGETCQSNVLDPDGMIQANWSYKQCCNSVCRLVWLDPAPLESELWKTYTSYHTHTKQKELLIPKTLLSMISGVVRVAMFPLWLANGIYNEKRQIRQMMLGQHMSGKLLDIGCGGGSRQGTCFCFLLERYGIF